MTSSQPIDAGIEERFAEQRVRLAAMSFPHALAVGDRAADFELPNARGRRVRLADRLERGPVVLTFYRGAWCPFCNLQLRRLQQALPAIEALRASLLAISPQLPDGLRAIVDKNGLTFEVLSDLTAPSPPHTASPSRWYRRIKRSSSKSGTTLAKSTATTDGSLPPRRSS
jgi:peroxiredoxin